MIGFGADLTKSNILNIISEYDIFKAYCSNFNLINVRFSSEFRDDSSPSCVINMFNGSLMYKDFGSSTVFRAFDYVQYKYGLSFIGVLEKINDDFNLKLGVISDNKKIVKPKYKPSNLSISKEDRAIKVITKNARTFNANDIKFWNSFGIRQSTLKLFDVEAISRYWIDGILYYAEEYSYSYNFYFENGVFRRKIYQPFSLREKWQTNGGKCVQGASVLPKSGELLIVTKSMKDVMSLYDLGYNSVAPPSESTFLPTEYIEKQISRFNRIVLLFDNDKTGKEFSTKFSDLYNLDSIFVPDECNVKDISDHTKKYGMNQSRTLLNSLLTNV